MAAHAFDAPQRSSGGRENIILAGAGFDAMTEGPLVNALKQGQLGQPEAHAVRMLLQGQYTDEAVQRLQTDLNKELQGTGMQISFAPIHKEPCGRLERYNLSTALYQNGKPIGTRVINLGDH